MRLELAKLNNKLTAGICSMGLVFGFGALAACGLQQEEEIDTSNVKAFLTSSADGHNHRLFVPYEAIYTPKIGGLVLTTTTVDRHSHEVLIRQEDLLAIVSGGLVVRPTSNTVGHQHEVYLTLGSVDAGSSSPQEPDAGIPVHTDNLPMAPDAGVSEPAPLPPDAGTAVEADAGAECDADPELAIE